MSEHCQRWRDRRHSWRHRSEGGFDSRRYDVGELAEASARAFVEQHHYSASYPASRLRYGLYEGPWLVGVAVLSVPVQRAVLTLPFPQLDPYAQSLELGRFVLLDQVPGNAESWFLAQAFRIAEREGIRGVVSFSDPVTRVTAAGLAVFPGHVGTIYQASNARYLGRGTARTLTLLPDGTVFSDRAASKVRSGERGHIYAEWQLRRFGARRLEWGEDRAAWLAEALATIGARRLRHRGNHRYAFKLGTPAERRAIVLGLRVQDYPKAIDLVEHAA